jgi:hypothetical protein
MKLRTGGRTIRLARLPLKHCNVTRQSVNLAGLKRNLTWTSLLIMLYHLCRKKIAVHTGWQDMRITLDLPEVLIKNAMRVSKQKTKTAVIIDALEDLVRRSRLQPLKSYKGKVNMDIDLATLRCRP